MDDLIKKAKKLLELVREINPQLNMEDPKQKELHLAYYSLAFKIAELEVSQLRAGAPNLSINLAEPEHDLMEDIKFWEKHSIDHKTLEKMIKEKYKITKRSK